MSLHIADKVNEFLKTVRSTDRIYVDVEKECVEPEPDEPDSGWNANYAIFIANTAHRDGNADEHDAQRLWDFEGEVLNRLKTIFKDDPTVEVKFYHGTKEYEVYRKT